MSFHRNDVVSGRDDRRSRLRAVIFDLDGCLVDSEPLSLGAIAAQMRMLGISDATAREIGDRFLGVAMPVITDYVSSRLGAPVPADFSDRVESQLLQSYRTELRQIPGARDLLQGVSEHGYSVAAATGGSLKRMAATLEISGLESWFEGTACSAEEVMHGKPAPDLFLLTLERLSLEPSECVVLEDSPHGIAGAVAAGIPAIGFVGGSHLVGQHKIHSTILRDAGAIEVFERLEDFKEFVLGPPV